MLYRSGEVEKRVVARTANRDDSFVWQVKEVGYAGVDGEVTVPGKYLTRDSIRCWIRPVTVVIWERFRGHESFWIGRLLTTSEALCPFAENRWLSDFH